MIAALAGGAASPRCGVQGIVYPRKPGSDVREILKRIKEAVGRMAVKHLREPAPHWLPHSTVQRGQRTEQRFWQAGGGYDRNIVEAKKLFALIDYLHQNPVRRELVVVASDWKWSSAAWLEGRGQNSLAPDRSEAELLPA